MFHLKTIFTLLSLIHSSITQCDKDIINYYENLIKENVKISENYVLPSFYQDFQLKNNLRDPIVQGSYDFVIIGGGTAGSLLANRISEIEDRSVLLIEAGGNGNDFTDITGMASYLRSSNFSWGYNTTVQERACLTAGGYRNEKHIPGLCSYTRGKGLGGCSLIHGNIFTRGIAEDFKKWTELGLSGWSFEELLPYMKKFENATNLIDIYPEYHGFEGEMKMENYKNLSQLAYAYMEAFEENGYKKTDYNGPHPFGYGRIQQSTFRGRRESTASVFLNETVTSRKNLHILTDSLVTKIIIERNRVEAVEYVFKYRKFRVNVNMEVILSAGVIGSPQILMLSGIGPKKHLKSLNIPVIKNLPVGKSFQDQLAVPIIVSNNFTQLTTTVREEIFQYLKGYGFFTSPTLGDVFLVIQKLKNLSNTEILIYDGVQLKLEDNQLKLYDPQVSTFINVLLHPKSVGTIKLKSNNPLDFPSIDPNLLGEEEDLNSIIETINNTLNIVESKSLKKFNVKSQQSYTSCEHYLYRSYEFLKCLANHYGYVGIHGISSCKMGLSKSNSVVNGMFLVHGMKNLRVIDASIIPVTITGHLFGTVLTVAEKGADLIKKIENNDL